MAFPDDPLKIRVRIAPDADLTALPDTYSWQDVTRDVSFSRSRPIVIKAGSADEEQEGTAEASLVLRNFPDATPNRESITQLHGRYTVGNPMSDLYALGFDQGCPVEISIDPEIDAPAWHVQSVQFLAEETPMWPDGTDYLAFSGWTLGSLLRRLQSGRAVKSALFRTLCPVPADLQPLDYWALESASTSDTARVTWPAENLDRQPTTPAASTAAYPGAVAGPIGSLGLPEWYGRNARLNASFQAVNIGSGDYDRTGFSLQLTPADGDAAIVHSFVVTLPVNSATVGKIELQCEYERDSAGIPVTASCRYLLRIIAPDGTLLDDNPTTGLNPFDGVPHYVEIETTRTSLVLYATALYIDGVEQFTLNNAGVCFAMQSAEFGEQGDLASSNNVGIAWSVGHLFHAASTADNVPLQAGWASLGYQGEYVHVRVERLCREEAVPCRDYDPDETVSMLMGPQLPASLVPLLRECERAEFGILDDHLGFVNLVLAQEMTSAEPWATLDGRDGQIYFPFAPTTDDARRANDVTVTRTGGGPGIRFTDDTDIARRGRYDKGVSVNVAGLGEQAAHASMAVAIGTAAGKRYPALTVDFLRSPDLISAWLALGDASVLGTRVDVTGQPLSLGSQDETIESQVRGYTLTITGRRGGLKVECNTVPFEPWRGAHWADAGNGGTSDDDPAQPLRMDHSASVISEDLTTTETDVSITSETVRWIDGQAPYVDDTFVTASASDWPASTPDGLPWVKFDGTTAADYTTGSANGFTTAGRHTITNTGNRRISAVDIGSGDGWVYSEHAWGVSVASTANLATRTYLRMTDASNYIAAHLELTTLGAVNLSVVAVVAGVATTLLASTEVGTGHAINEVWCVLAGVEGTDVTVSAWKKETVASLTGEGQWPPYEMTDTAGVSTAGHYFGVASQRDAGNTNSNIVSAYGEAAIMSTRYGRMFPFDAEVGGERMRVTAISGTTLSQTVTVVRSVNGVVKTHAAAGLAEQVRFKLWRPPRVALTG